MNTQTQEAFEKFWNTEIVSAVTGSIDTAMWGDIDRNDTAFIFMAGFKACKEALAQPAPKNCTPLDEYIAEMEKDPEIKQLLNIAREDVKKWSTQPAQEPVAWIEVTTHHEKYQTSKVILLDKGIGLPHDTPLYTHPAPSWQGLTSEEIRSLDLDNDVISVIFQTEKLLKEKNT